MAEAAKDEAALRCQAEWCSLCGSTRLVNDKTAGAFCLACKSYLMCQCSFCQRLALCFINGETKRIWADCEVVAENNQKDGEPEPPWVVETTKGLIRCFAVRIDGPSQAVYSTFDTPSLEINFWVVTEAPVVIFQG